MSCTHPDFNCDALCCIKYGCAECMTPQKDGLAVVLHSLFAASNFWSSSAEG